MYILSGSTENPTDDHIPAKNLFAKPRPNNLITVPSCKTCNESFHLDDDYFYMLMQTGIKTSNHPEVLKTKEKFIRSIHRKESAGFRRSILEHSSIQEVSTKSGIYLGNAPVLNVNWSRVDRVLEPICKRAFLIRKKDLLYLLAVLGQAKQIATKTKEEMEVIQQNLEPLAMQKEIYWK